MLAFLAWKIMLLKVKHAKFFSSAGSKSVFLYPCCSYLYIRIFTSRIVIYIKLFACISIEIPLEIETLILICHHNLILRSMLWTLIFEQGIILSVPHHTWLVGTHTRITSFSRLLRQANGTEYSVSNELRLLTKTIPLFKTYW